MPDSASAMCIGQPRTEKQEIAKLPIHKAELVSGKWKWQHIRHKYTNGVGTIDKEAVLSE